MIYFGVGGQEKYLIDYEELKINIMDNIDVMLKYKSFMKVIELEEDTGQLFDISLLFNQIYSIRNDERRDANFKHQSIFIHALNGIEIDSNLKGYIYSFLKPYTNLLERSTETFHCE
jgi:hypothetical protein